MSLIDEKRVATICHGQMYQKRMIKAFNKKIKHRVYQDGDLVIKHIILPQGDPRGKWTPTYEGPFVVKEVFFWRRYDANHYRRRRFPASCECGHSQKILYIKNDSLG